jgi:hypothetical protein
MSQYQDLDPEFLPLYQTCQHATMTSVERMYALYQAVNYIIDAEIPGDFVECGIWKGGSVMLMAAMLAARGETGRKIYLYDTFEGMSAPTAADMDLNGEAAEKLLAAAPDREQDLIWCLAPLDQVKANLAKIAYPMENFVFVQGKVEDTLATTKPGKIALLRLDTDWYESTRVEMEILYPMLTTSGILIVDDYGHWQGSRKAVDEYFARPESGPKILLNRIDYTGRLGVKI